MPIHGLTDRIRFTRAGKIRLGEKRTNASGKEYPAKLDYFLPDFGDAELEKEFTRLYGDKPKKLKVVFVGEMEEDIFPQWFKCYGSGSGLKCKGDGITAQRHTENGMEEVDCPTPEECDFAKQHTCKRLASLQFALPDLPTMSVVQIDTTSINSIININSGLAQMRAIFGRIQGYEVDLLLVPREITHDGKKVSIYVLEISIPVRLRDVGGVRPLLGGNVVAPKLIEAKPDDLYPAPAQTEPIPPAAEPDPPPSAKTERQGIYDALVILAGELRITKGEITAYVQETYKCTVAKLPMDELRGLSEKLRTHFGTPADPAPAREPGDEPADLWQGDEFAPPSAQQPQTTTRRRPAV